METVQVSPPENQNAKNTFSDLKPIVSFFATSSLYGISLALLLGFFLAGGLMILSKIN